MNTPIALAGLLARLEEIGMVCEWREGYAVFTAYCALCGVTWLIDARLSDYSHLLASLNAHDTGKCETTIA